MADIEQTEDGGYVVGGLSEKDYLDRAWLLKLSRQGEVEWEKLYKGGTHKNLGHLLFHGVISALFSNT